MLRNAKRAGNPKFQMKNKIKILLPLSFLLITTIFIPQKSFAFENLFSVDANTISLWRFNEVSGNTVIDSTGTNNGTALGTAIVDGKFGKARYFNGWTDYIVIPDSPSLNNFSQITIEAWVYPQGFDLGCWALSEGLVIKGDASDFYASNAYGLEMVRNYDTSCVSAYSFRKISFGMYFGSAGVSSLEHDPNQWYYVVGTFDGSKARIYINGVEENSGIAPAQIVANSRDLYINHHTWSGSGASSQRMQGLIDEIRISRIARSAEEITYYYNLTVNQPPIFSNPNQYKSDGETPIDEGRAITENTVMFKATVNDPDNDSIKLQIEPKEFNQSFNEQDLLESNFVSSGSEAVVSREPLVVGSYKWRARAVDDKGNVSEWQEFRTPGNVDFIVKTLEQAAADLAKELVNTAYLYGGKGWDYAQSEFVATDTVKTGYNFWNQSLETPSVDFDSGVDCSGLVMWAYNRSFDPNKSRFNNFVKVEGTDEQFRENTTTTTESELQPGDVMFFDFNSDESIDHVAMYVGESGGFDVVSAASRAQGIVPVSKDDLKQLPGFVVFKRVISALQPAILVSAGSPVDLTVTDPDGFTIMPTTIVPSDLEFLRQIPGVLYYSEMERGTDGNPIDQVYSYTLKKGDYTIKVLSTPDASPTSTYTLDFSTANQSTTLAQDVPISQIPSQGYGVTTSESGTINPFVPVAIDIKPSSYPNSINLKSNGVTPVAILGSATFNVKQIDPTTIKLANAGVKLKGNGQLMASYQDIDGDGFTDIVVHIVTDALQLTSADVKANLDGRLISGEIIKGSDSVRIVSK